MSWRVAESLITLREQVNAAWPHRSKDSDGTIGNAEHASRSSDHNPWVKDGRIGVVTAMDVTNDPANGLASRALAEALIASRDPRIKYVISQRQICAGMGGPAQWSWRPYTGVNPHEHHCHVSVREDKAHYDNAGKWTFDPLAVTMEIKPSIVSATPAAPAKITLRRGAIGGTVADAQRLLNKHGANLSADGEFGAVTYTAVAAFQRSQGLVPDGVIGPSTWEKLEQA